ncbi:hypothetical protein TRFO_11976 [Tritrichomonas foetus]|uniref:Initiator binding domain-containing protein n=1 Tax=Tritrichomonas foetus TaxID=1144522 RepID=A0A1J4J6V6_9EUKA|nr:hypothetical protein TRFO_11976 [Tritrichomonas foetus]|eukprot:OHS93165.1 hypothetical protein TRFO_11976 [Tritrichomonas foetus]
MDDPHQIPQNILSFVRSRSTRSENTRFPYKLNVILTWVGADEEKSENAGCGWISHEEFFIDKSKLCEVMNVKLNTLNVNLKTLGFKQTRPREGNKTYYKNDEMSFNSENTTFSRIRNSRCKPEALLNLQLPAVYLPCLEPLHLFMMDRKSIDQFKKCVIDKWEELVGGKLIFAVPLKDFIKALEINLNDTLFTDTYVIQQALVPRIPNVMDIFDFAVFLARFGPFENIQTKMNQYQGIFMSDFYFSSNSLSTSFSDTFHNCFRFSLLQVGEYHCYNLPLVSTTAYFLIDEDGICYPSWSEMLQRNYFLSHTPNFQ